MEILFQIHIATPWTTSPSGSHSISPSGNRTTVTFSNISAVTARRVIDIIDGLSLRSHSIDLLTFDVRELNGIVGEFRGNLSLVMRARAFGRLMSSNAQMRFFLCGTNDQRQFLANVFQVPLGQSLL